MSVQGRDLLTGKPKQVDVSYREIAKALDKTPNDVNRLLRLNERTLSVDTPMGDDTEKPLLEALADQQNDGLAARRPRSDSRAITRLHPADSRRRDGAARRHPHKYPFGVSGGKR